MTKQSDLVVEAAQPAVLSSDPKAVEAATSAAHVIAALGHDPAAIRRLFESGENPYKSMMRTAVYEAHMLELQGSC